MEDERTLVILKPDAVKRGLIGDVISRFEKTGLKMVGAKMVRAERSLLEKHYPADREDLTRNIGQRTLESYKEMGLDPKEQFGETDPSEDWSHCTELVDRLYDLWSCTGFRIAGASCD